MASYKSLVIILVVATLAVVLPTVTVAKEYWVGDSIGWTLDYDYKVWAKDNAFQVGDALVFNYTQDKHDVVVVDGNGFNSCVAPPGQGLKTGHDVVNLTAPGKKWYICSVADHCIAHGMKLAINVEGAASAPAPNAAPAISTSRCTIFTAAAAISTLAASMIIMG